MPLIINAKPVILAVFCLILSGVIAVGTNSAYACHGDGNCAERYQAVHGINWITATADQVREWHKNGGELGAVGEGVTFPLNEAASQANIAAVKTLLELGADVNSKTNSGWTPLHAAAWYGNAEVISVLISAGADVNAKDNDGDTPLHGAAASGKAEVIPVLLQAGADVNAKTNSGWTPLHAAAWHADNPEVIRLLIDEGANVQAREKNGWTPLHLAAKYNKNPAIFAALIAYGAQINALNNDGKSPLDIAKAENNAVAVGYLERATAIMNAENNDGKSPLDIAKAENNAVAVGFLESAGAVAVAEVRENEKRIADAKRKQDRKIAAAKRKVEAAERKRKENKRVAAAKRREAREEAEAERRRAKAAAESQQFQKDLGGIIALFGAASGSKEVMEIGGMVSGDEEFQNEVRKATEQAREYEEAEDRRLAQEAEAAQREYEVAVAEQNRQIEAQNAAAEAEAKQRQRDQEQQAKKQQRENEERQKIAAIKASVKQNNDCLSIRIKYPNKVGSSQFILVRNFTNRCSKPIFVAMAYWTQGFDANDPIRCRTGWWHFEAGESTTWGWGDAQLGIGFFNTTDWTSFPKKYGHSRYLAITHDDSLFGSRGEAFKRIDKIEKRGMECPS